MTFIPGQYAKEQELLEQVENIPRFTVLYRDGEAVAAVTTHEHKYGVNFSVNGYEVTPCFSGSKNTYCREYYFEACSGVNESQKVLTAYQEALDAAELDIGAKPKQDYTLWLKECQSIAASEYDCDVGGGVFAVCYEANVSPEKVCEMLLIKF